MATDAFGLTRRAAVRGAFAGAVAWATGFAAATLASRLVFGSGTLSSGGFVFYNAHLVPLSRVGGVATGGGNALLAAVGSLGLAAVLLPGGLLAVAGGVLARLSRAESAPEAAAAGAAVAVGYFAFAVVGALVVTGPFFGGVYRPNVVYAASLAGVVFPVVAGGVGGVLALGVGWAGRRIAALRG